MENRMGNRKKKNLLLSGIMLLVIAGFLLFLYFGQKPCPTDLNADEKTDSIDLELLKKVYGKKVSENVEELLKYDLSNDSIINAADLSILVSMYGQKCN